jgi:hypothetical protein
MNRSQMRPRSSRPSLMRARTTLTKPFEGKDKPLLGKGKTLLGKGKPLQGKGRSKTWKLHRPTTTTMVVAGGAIVVAAAAIAALPMTRRTFRRFTAKRRTKLVTPVGLDELTGLPNRAEAERMLGAALERGRPPRPPVADLNLVVLDIKQCNDT